MKTLTPSAALNEELINILNEELYLYLQTPNGKRYRDWDEVNPLFNDLDERTRDFWRKKVEVLVGVSSNKNTLNKYLPATQENMKMLQAGKEKI